MTGPASREALAGGRPGPAPRRLFMKHVGHQRGSPGSGPGGARGWRRGAGHVVGTAVAGSGSRGRARGRGACGRRARSRRSAPLAGEGFW